MFACSDISYLQKNHMAITITLKIIEEQIPENTLMQIYSEKFNNWIKAEE